MRIKDAWAASAIALSLDFERETEHQREMAAFGQQCYQDRCENAYVEQSVMKKTVTEAEEAVARRCAEIAREVVDGLEDAEFNCDIYGPIQLAIRREFGLPTTDSSVPQDKDGVPVWNIEGTQLGQRFEQHLAKSEGKSQQSEGSCHHERLNEDGICRRCGADCRGIY